MQTAVGKRRKKKKKYILDDNTCGFRFTFQTEKLKHLKGIGFTLQVLWSFQSSYTLQMGELEH